MSQKPNVRPSDEDFGAVLNCAIRYCLGRRSYMPGLVMDYITPLLSYISDRTLNCLHRDVSEAEQMGYGYGDPDIDKPRWMRFLADVEAEQGRRSGHV